MSTMIRAMAALLVAGVFMVVSVPSGAMQSGLSVDDWGRASHSAARAVQGERAVTRDGFVSYRNAAQSGPGFAGRRGAMPTLNSDIADPNEPVLSVTYGWEDEVGTILGSSDSEVISAANVGDFVNSGNRALRVTESPHGPSAPHVYLAHIRNLQDGDIVRASFWAWDNTPNASPSVRIWGHYTIGDDLTPIVQTSGSNQAFSAGVGWEEMEDEWVFNSQSGDCAGDCDGLVIQVRLYASPNNCERCSTDFWIDDLAISVYCADNSDLVIELPNGALVGDPLTPNEVCEPFERPKEPPPTCPQPLVSGFYDWGDGEGTILGSNNNNVITPENTSEFFLSPPSALRVVQSPHTSGAVHIYLAHIKGLQPGDEITAGFWTYDDSTPNTHPRVRIWAHYTNGNTIGVVNQHSGNLDYSTGIGWEELSHSWEFGTNANWGGLVIQARLYTPACADPPCATEFNFDDLWIHVCSANPEAVEIDFPDEFDPGEPDPGDPPPVCESPTVATTYGWEDGDGTILGGASIGNITVENTSEEQMSGFRSLKATEHGHASGARILFLGRVDGLSHGDVVKASFWTLDETDWSQGSVETPAGRVRIWARYTTGPTFSNLVSIPQQQQNTEYSSGIGWEEMGHAWEFDSSLGSGLVIEARLYGSPTTCGSCSMDYFIDDLSIQVCAAEPGNVTVTLPQDVIFEPPPPPPTCDDPDILTDYGWEDGDGTILGGASITNVVVENTTELVRTGTRALKATETIHTTGARILYLARIDNLSDGDLVRASFWTHDDTPGFGTTEEPTGSVRIWARYTTGSGFSNLASIDQSMQNTAFSSGIGWEEMGHTWQFDASEGNGLVIEARLYGSPASCPTCSMDYFIDDLSIDVCSANPENIIITLPIDAVFEPEPPIEMCKDPMWGMYGWEDGKGTAVGTNNTSGVITLTNITSDQGPVNSQDRALRINESPDADGTPQIHLAFIENLQHGDTIRASVFAYDDTPGVNPIVRIFGRYAFAGSPEFTAQSAGGNDISTSGIGWEELTHTWLFDQGAGDVPRDALLVHVRVYAPSCNSNHPAWDPETESCPTASTDYFVDDLLVEVCSEHPNVTITFPDGTIIGDPPIPSDCIADLDNNGVVDHGDAVMVWGSWGTPDEQADVNNDGDVDGADIGIVLASFGPCSEFLFPMPGSAGLVLETSGNVAGGLAQYDLYVQLDADEALVNVYDATVTSTLGFEDGSFITIGADSPHFDVIEDPNFDFGAFCCGTSMGVNAGWFNFDPPNNLGWAGQYPNNRVLIARLLVDPKTEFDAELSVSYRDGDGRARQVTLNLDEPQPPSCLGDITGSAGTGPDGQVNGFDLLALLGCWGPVTTSECEAADIASSSGLGSDGQVNGFDLLALLGNWGPCD